MPVSSRFGRGLVACSVLVCALALLAAPAGAAVVSVGPELKSLDAGGHNVECTSGSGCLVSQKSPSYISPLTGMVVGWRVKASSGTLTLRVLHGNTGVLGAATATAEAGKTLPARIPVEAGERFGVAIPHVSGTNLGFAQQSGSTFSAWSPALIPGETRPPDQNSADVELLFNVLVQPPPGISAVTPASGPVDTQDTVTISGHDFIGVEDVSFGAFSAEYKVVSETTIVAKTSSNIASAVPLTITTRAGTVSIPAAFSFEEAAGSGPKTPTIPPLAIPDLSAEASPDLTFPSEVECQVPKLKGKTLKQAKPVLAAAHCKLGRVSKRKGVKAKRGKVVSELPPAGSRAAAEAHVQVRLG
jgi:hypothetical protein